MKLLLAFCILLVVQQLVVESATPQEARAAMQKVCREKNGLSEADVAHVYDDSKTGKDTDKIKCYILCKMEETNLYKNDAIDVDAAIKYILNLPKFKGREAAITAALNDCKSVKGANRCDHAYQIYTCFGDHDAIIDE